MLHITTQRVLSIIMRIISLYMTAITSTKKGLLKKSGDQMKEITAMLTSSQVTRITTKVLKKINKIRKHLYLQDLQDSRLLLQIRGLKDQCRFYQRCVLLWPLLDDYRIQAKVKHTCKKREIPEIYLRKFFWIFRKILG